MENNKLPKPVYKRGHVIMWSLFSEDGSVSTGGFGRVIGGRYVRPSENLKSGWFYSIEGDDSGVWESDVTDSYEEI